MDIQSMFTLKRNKDAKRFEFEPNGNYTGYLVSFFEVDADESNAWITVYKALILEGRI